MKTLRLIKPFARLKPFPKKDQIQSQETSRGRVVTLDGENFSLATQ